MFIQKYTRKAAKDLPRMFFCLFDGWRVEENDYLAK